jgi:hypothetical protein
MSKTSKKNNVKSGQLVKNKRFSGTPSPVVDIFNREIRYLKIKDVKRAYSKLIQDYCKGLIEDNKARTLVYMFSGYLQIVRDIDFEERLIRLEELINESKK